MEQVVLYAIVSVVIVSLLSIIVGLPLFMRKTISKHTLIFLLSVSVGVLLATVFFEFIPEMYEEGHAYEGTFYLLIGFLVMFVLEKFVHYHHSHNCESPAHEGHSHAYSVAPLNLIGDGVHNFIDGIVIAGSYLVSIPTGIATTIAVTFHELPQELADIGVLIYSGIEKRRALLYNFFSGVMAVVGTIIGLVLSSFSETFVEFIIPFAAGNFLYIAASNLLPQLHRHCSFKETIMHICAIILGIALIIAAGFVFPHGH